MACLDDETVVAFAQGDLSEALAAAVDEHLQTCARCGLLVAEVAKSLHPAVESDGRGEDPEAAAHARGAEAPEPILAPETVVGRYVIQSHVARGGGGTVYEAYDPQLKRKIALKLLKLSAVAGQAAVDVQARLLREAEAMARMAHPNITHVYDAGLYNGQVFIVAEFVEGETLTRWLRRQSRPWREVMGAFQAAGEGLVSIHDAGLAHGDFKPDNVLVGRDGRIRLTDFGLARPLGLGLEAPLLLEGASSSPGAAVTAVGGTALYMAPEQLGGAAPSAATDQYSFCVSLFLGLCGRHPSGDKVMVLLASRQTSFAVAGGVPPAVVQILLRGASQRLEDRFPSLRALLDALARAAGTPAAPAVRGARRFLGPALGFLGLAAIVLAIVVTWRVPREQRIRPAAGARCGDGMIWSPVEECDDGNNDDSDGCTTSCRRCPKEAGRRFHWPATGHCYELHETPVDWETARTTCAERGSALVVLSEAERIAVATEISAAKAWIGLRRASPTGMSLWVTGEPFSPATRMGWEKRLAGAGPVNCAAQIPNPPSTKRGLGGTWIPSDCADRYPFICEDVDWMIDPGSGHAYRVFFDERTWGDSRQACQRKRGHLATITSKTEMEFLAPQIAVEVWIGASDAEQEGVFKWATGEPFLFQQFAPAELDLPVSTKPNDCVVLGLDRLWHDRRCRLSFNYLCEVEPPR